MEECSANILNVSFVSRAVWSQMYYRMPDKRAFSGLDKTRMPDNL